MTTRKKAIESFQSRERHEMHAAAGPVRFFADTDPELMAEMMTPKPQPTHRNVWIHYRETSQAGRGRIG